MKRLVAALVALVAGWLGGAPTAAAAIPSAADAVYTYDGKLCQHLGRGFAQSALDLAQVGIGDPGLFGELPQGQLRRPALRRDELPEGADMLPQLLAHHPFWNNTDRKYEPADQLEPGDQLLTANGTTLTVTKLDTTTQTGTVWNLTIDGTHTYTVGTTATIVHNCNLGGLADDAANTGSTALRGVDEVLGGLSKGKQGFVRTVPDEASLNSTFAELTQGGSPTTWKNFSGTVIERGDGVQVGLWSCSKSGGSTIDIRMPDGSFYRIDVDQ